MSLPLFSCKEGCVAADEFDSQSITIESYPDQIYGTYDPINGGQRIDWKDSGLKVNGTALLMQISGSWTSLQGGTEGSKDKLDLLPRCNICAKKDGVDNCICRGDQEPEAELDISGKPYAKAADGTTTLDCASNASHQDDAVRCTCTKQHGKATDYGLYHFPRDLLNKDQTVKIPDQQNNCKYDRGMGAYMALWGNRGVSTPIRAYHLYSEESACNVTLDSNGRCLDSSGKDMTRWIFRSANQLPFMKDDGDGNDEIDLNTGNDVYHGTNEVLKTIMYDQYYRDNYGSYNVQIFGGVGNANETGLLEYLVGLVEDMLLGKKDGDNNRDGGIVRTMYQSIVSDSGFAQLVQISLALYIAIFGAAHLWGLVEMNKKEIVGRTLKVGLIMLFVSPESWTFYNTFVVGFFKDALDSVVGIFLTLLADSDAGQTSTIKIAQMEAVEVSSASRFAYVDLIIRNLMSEAVAKKIMSLFFNSFFGWFYIIAIYALIFAFIAIMLYVAVAYIVNYLMKIIFVMSIGPIFIVFSLFTKTSGYFRNWVSYLAGRSFEMLILFIVLYLFVTIIDKNFTEMLLFKACSENFGIGPVKLLILKADIDRTLIQWVLYFVTIAGLIWIMYEVIDKVPQVAGSLFTINIAGGKADGGFSFGSADFYKDNPGYSGGGVGSVARDALGIGIAAGGAAAGLASNYILSPALTGLASAANALGNATGFNSAYNAATGGGIAGSVMNSQFNAAMGESKTGEAGARTAFTEAMREQMKTDPAKMAALGINEKSISAFLDQKLVKEPLQDFLKGAAKEMKNLPADKIPIGESAVAAYLGGKASEWSKKNMSESSATKVADFLKDNGIKDLMRNHGTMSAKEAAKAFAGNKELENKYRADLAHRQFEEKQKGDSAWKNPLSEGIGRLASNIYHGATNNPYHNPGKAQKDFEKARERELNPTPFTFRDPRYVPGDIYRGAKSALKDPIGSLNKALEKSKNKPIEAKQRKAAEDKMIKEGRLGVMRSHLRKSSGPVDTAGMDRASRKATEKENQKNQFFRDELRKGAIEDAGFHPDHKKREELLRNFGKDDGRTIFEKAASLDQLNKHLGYGGESAATTLAKMMKVEATLSASKAKRGDKKAEEKLQRLGNDGMYGTELDQKVLDRFLKKELDKKQGADAEDKRSNGEIDAELDKHQKDTKKQLDGLSAFQADPQKALDAERAQMDETTSKAQKEAKEAADAGDQEKAKAILLRAGEQMVEKNPSILPEGVSLKQIFGEGASGLLMQDPMENIGPKAGSVIPGQDGKPSQDGASETEINSLKMTNNQLHGQIKLIKMNLQLKEIDLEQAKAKGESITEIQQQITKLEQDLGSRKSDYEKADNYIAELSKK